MLFCIKKKSLLYKACSSNSLLNQTGKILTKKPTAITTKKPTAITTTTGSTINKDSLTVIHTHP